LRLRSTPRKIAVEHLTGLSAFVEAHALVVNDAGSSSAYASGYPSSPMSQKGLLSKRAPSERANPGWRAAWWLAGVVALTLAGVAVFKGVGPAALGRWGAGSNGPTPHPGVPKNLSQ
jgi:hypothetical protein